MGEKADGIISIGGENKTFVGVMKVQGFSATKPYIRLQTIRSTAIRTDPTSLGNQAVYATKDQALEVVRAILKAISESERNDDA